MNKMKLLYIFGEIDAAGGLQKVQINKANYFAEKAGYEVGIITTLVNPDGVPFFSLDPRVHVFISPQYSLSSEGRRAGILGRIKMACKYRKFAADVMKQFHPDIVVHAGGYEILFLWRVKWIKKWVCEFHFSRESEKWLPRRNNVDMMLRLLVSKTMDFIRTKSDAFVVLTKEDEHDWLKSGLRFRRLLHIYNVAPFVPVSDRNATDRKKKIIAVGRLDFQKNFKDLIYIWNKIENRFPEWCLEIYGVGPECEMLKGEIEKLDLKHVKLCGKSKTIRNEMLSSEIYALTSTFEGFPLVLLEAMACGLPCVSFDCKCGPRELVIENKNGFLIENRDLLLFAQKLELLMSDQNLRNNQGAHSLMFMKNFSEDKVMEQWHLLYLSLATKELE